MGRNDIPSTSRTISIITGDFQNGLFTETHLNDTFVPSTNNLTNPNPELEGTSLISGGIELGPIASQRPAVKEKKETGTKWLNEQQQNGGEKHGYDF